MPRLFAVLDTNVYRSLGGARFEELQRLERSQAVLPVANRWVALEFLAHIATPGVEDFVPARRALGRYVEHCRTYNGSQYKVSFIATPEEQVAHSMIGYHKPKDEVSQHIGSYIEVAALRSDDDVAANQEGFEEIRREVRRIEERFVDNFWNNVVLHTVPEATAWTDVVDRLVLLNAALEELRSDNVIAAGAETVVAGVQRICGAHAFDREELIAALSQRCAAAFRLQAEMLAQVLQRGRDLRARRHANTIFDIYIVTSAMIFAGLDPTPLWVITDDKMVRDAAAKVGLEQSVISLSSYIERLRGPLLND